MKTNVDLFHIKNKSNIHFLLSHLCAVLGPTTSTRCRGRLCMGEIEQMDVLWTEMS